MALRLLVLLIAYLLRIKNFLDFEKLRPFECGFIPQAKFRSPFSMHFFLIAIIFLIFDVELVLLFPYLLNFNLFQISIEVFLIVILILT
ncbi:UNVERIFIED_CONTAM: hypothetical protein GTU68_022293 [Idotea baltica]|nr:hypothetical protein [Idotea baltica]